MSIMRLATKPIISLRRSSSEPFSSSAFRVILSIVMVRSLGCVWWFATRANLDSDHDSSPLAGATVDALGKKAFKGVLLSGRPTAALRATPRLGSYTTSGDANPLYGLAISARLGAGFVVLVSVAACLPLAWQRLSAGGWHRRGVLAALKPAETEAIRPRAIA